MRALLVPSEIDKFVTVTDNGFPLFFKKSFELREVLQDNADRYAAGTHDRENFIKVIGERNIGELVHHKMHGNRQCAASAVRNLEQLLKQLRIQHRYKEVEARVVVGDQGKQRHLFGSQCFEVKLIYRAKQVQAFQIEFLQSCLKRNLNGFQRFCRAAAISRVILQRDMSRILLRKIAEHFVKYALLIAVLLVDLTRRKQLQYLAKGLLIRVCLGFHIKDECHQQHTCRCIPERVL